MNIGRFTVVALALAAVTFTGIVRAQTTVFDAFGPGNSFRVSTGYPEGGPTSPVPTPYSSIGAVFSPSATGSLSAVSVAYYRGASNPTAHLYLTDSFSNVGKTGTAFNLETFVFAAPNSQGSVVVLPSALHPILTAGQTYYLYGLEPENI